MGNRNKTKNSTAWMKKQPKEYEKVMFGQALANYIVNERQPDDPYPKPNAATYKAVLPYLQKLNPKWEVVTSTNFSMHQYEMHKSYGDTLRSLLESEKKLAKMVDEAKSDPTSSDPNEEADDELDEKVNDNRPDNAADQKVVVAKSEPA